MFIKSFQYKFMNRVVTYSGNSGNFLFEENLRETEGIFIYFSTQGNSGKF